MTANNKEEKQQEQAHMYYAALMLPILVERVLSEGESLITYSELADSVGYPYSSSEHGKEFADAIGTTLWHMDKTLRGLSKDELPFITALVVRVHGYIPGPGFGNIHKPYLKMDVPQKKEFVRQEEKRIVAYGEKWCPLAAKLALIPLKYWRPKEAGYGFYKGDQ